MNYFTRRILRIANILALFAVIGLPKFLLYLAENTLDYYGSIPLGWFSYAFAVPVAYVCAIIVLLRQHMGSPQYCRTIEGLYRNAKLESGIWIFKILLCVAGLISCVPVLWSNSDFWYGNYNVCGQAGILLIPLLLLDLIERVIQWRPIIQDEMSAQHPLWLRLLFTGKTLLFAGVAVRRTMLEKLIHVVRIYFWLQMVRDLTLYFFDIFHYSSLQFFIAWGAEIVHYPRTTWLVMLRLVELVFFDPD